MIAKVRRSYNPKFVEGDVFQIDKVLAGDTEDPLVFRIFAPMQSYFEEGCLHCERVGCPHLGYGEWEIIYEKGERG